jgi:hypothetical protein
MNKNSAIKELNRIWGDNSRWEEFHKRAVSAETAEFLTYVYNISEAQFPELIENKDFDLIDFSKELFKKYKTLEPEETPKPKLINVTPYTVSQPTALTEPPEFLEIWEKWPPNQFPDKKDDALSAWNHALKSGFQEQELIDAAELYISQTESRQHNHFLSTFFSSEEDFKLLRQYIYKAKILPAGEELEEFNKIWDTYPAYPSKELDRDDAAWRWKTKIPQEWRLDFSLSVKAYTKDIKAKHKEEYVFKFWRFVNCWHEVDRSDELASLFGVKVWLSAMSRGLDPIREYSSHIYHVMLKACKEDKTVEEALVTAYEWAKAAYRQSKIRMKERDLKEFDFDSHELAKEVLSGKDYSYWDNAQFWSRWDEEQKELLKKNPPKKTEAELWAEELAGLRKLYNPELVECVKNKQYGLDEWIWMDNKSQFWEMPGQFDLKGYIAWYQNGGKVPEKDFFEKFFAESF